MTSRHHRGFTLLETILAVGLAALLMGLLGAGMRIYTRTVSQRRADVVNAQVARVILNQIAKDLRATYVGADGASSAPTDVGLEDDTDTGDGSDTTDTTEEEISEATADLEGTAVQPTPGLYGNQSQLQIDIMGRFTEPAKFDTLTAAGVDPQAGNLLSDPKVVTYFLRPINGGELAGTPLQSLGDTDLQTVLVRRVASRAEAVYEALYGAATTQAGEQLVSDQVVLLQFMYHDGFDWLDSWDSSIDGGLPMAVNITIAVVNESEAADVDINSLTTDSLFEQTVYLPTAELPETTLDEGI